MRREHLNRLARIAKALEIRSSTIHLGDVDRIDAYAIRMAKRMEQVISEVESKKSADQDEAFRLRPVPQKLPPREDVRKRYKKEDIRREDRADYYDTLFDPDMSLD